VLGLVKFANATLKHLATGKLALLFGGLICLAGLLSYPMRAVVFILWPEGPVGLADDAAEAVSILIYPGLHFAGWIASGFPAGANDGYFMYLLFGLLGLVLNLMLWTSLSYLMLLAAGGAQERVRD
jgi:uncharacterized membrane protein YeaQ/YmgE (transglycosylase-associated protein family)